MQSQMRDLLAIDDENTFVSILKCKYGPTNSDTPRISRFGMARTALRQRCFGDPALALFRAPPLFVEVLFQYPRNLRRRFVDDHGPYSA